MYCESWGFEMNGRSWQKSLERRVLVLFVLLTVLTTFSLLAFSDRLRGQTLDSQTVYEEQPPLIRPLPRNG